MGRSGIHCLISSEPFSIIGCVHTTSLCYVHVSDQKKRKLDSKAKHEIFSEYNNHSKCYRVLILENEKIEVSRDENVKKTRNGIGEGKKNSGRH